MTANGRALPGAAADGVPCRPYRAGQHARALSQARWTCGGDHLSPVDWAARYVADRDRGTLLRGYWLPLSALAIVMSLVLGIVFPSV